MQIVIMYVGKSLGREYASIASAYEKRLQPFATLTWQEIKPSKPSKNSNGLSAKAEESTAVLAKLQPNDQMILLDERGTQQSNEAFANTFAGLAQQQGRLVIVIGGAFGVDDSVRERANFVWSLSQLVFPHQLVRVLLLEQLYRTFAVQFGHPYHHAE